MSARSSIRMYQPRSAGLTVAVSNPTEIDPMTEEPLSGMLAPLRQSLSALLRLERIPRIMGMVRVVWIWLLVMVLNEAGG